MEHVEKEIERLLILDFRTIGLPVISFSAKEVENQNAIQVRLDCGSFYNSKNIRISELPRNVHMAFIRQFYDDSVRMFSRVYGNSHE